MKRQDVKPGNVYAYREGSYGTYRKAVVLTPVLKDTLYTTQKWKNDKGYFRDKYRTSPAGYNGYTPASGWLMAIGRDPSKATLQEALEHGKQISEDGLPVEWDQADYEYKIITSMSYLHGDYEKLVNAERIQAEANALRAKQRREENIAVAETFVPVRDSFREILDGKVDLMTSGHVWEPTTYNIGVSAPTHLRLDFQAAEELVSLLSERTQLIKILQEENDRLIDRIDSEFI